MGKISLDLTTIKAAGVYTIEIDNTVRTTTTTNSLRMIPGFSDKGPFNRPVFLQNDNDRLSIFGDIDTKLEHKGCYFNRMMRTLLQDGPIIALNLLSVDNSYNGPDQVNFAAMSLDAGKPNPKVSGSRKYGEYDYLGGTLDKDIYDTEDGDMIPYVGNTPFSSLYNRSRFWIPDKDLLTSVASKSLGTLDFATGSGSYEHTNFLNFANVGTEEFSILVFKPENIIGYDITAESWYGSVENIPFGWIRPSDYISDYFLQVVCVKGNWTNYPVLSTDPMWKAYFDKNGIIKSRINNFINAEGVQLIGSWMGCIIPDFINKQGDNLSLENKINARTEITGLLMSFNEDAAHVVAGDYTGPDSNENDDYFDNTGKFTWGIDIDGDREIDSVNGEGTAPYIVDMVGHGAFKDFDEDDITEIVYEYLKNDSTVFNDEDGHTYTLTNLVHRNNSNKDVKVNVSLIKDKDGNITGIKSVNAGAPGSKEWTLTYPGVYIPKDFLALPEHKVDENNTDTSTLLPIKQALTSKFVTDIFTKNPYYVVKNVQEQIDSSTDDTTTYTGKIETAYVNPANVAIIYYDIDDNGNPVTNTKDLVHDVPVGSKNDSPLRIHTLKVAFSMENATYFAYFRYTTQKQGNKVIIQSFEPGVGNISLFAAGNVSIVSGYYHNEKKDSEQGFLNISSEETPDTEQYKIVISPSAHPECTEIPELHYILVPQDPSEAIYKIYKLNKSKKHTIGFLSYGYVYDHNEDELDPDKNPSLEIMGARYFNDPELWEGECPVTNNTLNMFIVSSPGNLTKNDGWNAIQVGTLVRNITYKNEPGDANKYKIIPGVTRVIRKQFIPVDINSHTVNYMSKTYDYLGDTSEAKNGATGFYLYTTIDPVLIETKVNEDNTTETYITRQLPLTDNVISNTLRFIPMKGLKITSRHRPGYASDGTISIEGGIEKIYSVLTDSGIRRGLCNPTMVDYRYIVDSMSYGLETSLGGKAYLSQLAQDRGSCLAILNLPSAKQFAVSSNPIFCDAYTSGAETRPSFDTKYIPQGGNQEMGSSRIFSLPDENDGSKYAAAFFPNLIYSENGRKISVPPAADVCNVLASKFTGVNSPYGICANMSGIIRNRYVTDIEFAADTDDRGYLEPFGVNTIIKESGYIMIYGNQTCYQILKSDLNKLHVRENLNTLEIECTAALKRFNFLYNTPQTRAAVVQTLTPILSVMQVSGAIDSFTITCDESNNTPEIIEGDYGIVDIDVWFNHGMEKILTRIKINRQGTNQGE